MNINLIRNIYNFELEKTPTKLKEKKLIFFFFKCSETIVSIIEF
jgi:hypothetical protein